MSLRVTNGPVRSASGTVSGFVPGQRAAPVDPGRHRLVPTVNGLAAEALMLVRRDDIPSSGFLVAQHKGQAQHRHEVWVLGPFALLDDGWFGQVRGPEVGQAEPERWLRRHERRCELQHWTRFRWVDPDSLEPGCGDAGVGLGLGADGPTYCPGHVEVDPEHPSHVALTDVMRAGLRALALGL